eukprot:CAMPEP_0113322008 /NCGR_PEP_ID=MMETSP0010_2-20120614/15304_1 /TAXON_ID=216773 ORGANISM="Corethron hystrix, Strain 308" /NCGR_SAMPLE_ID=MMETSP0010_2 /ASSEMBLY_ACC=CAM_ASM_000155 /LENGTH=245 /DNA_ID=CAMNT_0000180335 /DNA_START=407 /DNA_END=1141 /DNA_ORIENTATION=- /assembly_acc=CAM_ASM_000155
MASSSRTHCLGKCEPAHKQGSKIDYCLFLKNFCNYADIPAYPKDFEHPNDKCSPTKNTVKNVFRDLALGIEAHPFCYNFLGGALESGGSVIQIDGKLRKTEVNVPNKGLLAFYFVNKIWQYGMESLLEWLKILDNETSTFKDFIYFALPWIPVFSVKDFWDGQKALKQWKTTKPQAQSTYLIDAMEKGDKSIVWTYQNKYEYSFSFFSISIDLTTYVHDAAFKDFWKNGRACTGPICFNLGVKDK